jgi:hypothetical protein
VDGDDRIKKTPSLIDNISEPFMVRVREITLERRGLDDLYRQYGQQHSMSGERFLVRSNHAASGFSDRLCRLCGSSCWLF